MLYMSVCVLACINDEKGEKCTGYCQFYFYQFCVGVFVSIAASGIQFSGVDTFYEFNCYNINVR